MALKIHIPACIHNPPHPNHSPPLDKPFRIDIQGPLETIEKLLPGHPWNTDHLFTTFPQPGGPKLASLAYESLYGQKVRPKVHGGLVVRDGYLAWTMVNRRPLAEIDYYGVTFDHLVPIDNLDPEVLCLGINEVDNDGGAFADEVLPFKIDPKDYTGKKVLVVPRCCQIKKGTQDRGRVNTLVVERDAGRRTVNVDPLILRRPDDMRGNRG